MTSAKTGGTALYRYEPDYAIPPGDIIAEFIEEQGMTQVELARRLGVTTKHLNQLIRASVSLSNELAIALERVTGTPARFWNALEANFQDFEAREREVDDLSADLPWLDELPLKELITRGHIQDKRNRPVDQLREVLKFFGVAGRSSFDEVCASAAYRKSNAYGSDQYAVAAWLRVGELQAAGVQCEPFDKSAFRSALREIRSLTKLTDPNVWLPRLTELCAASGVVVLLVPEIGKSRLSGAARWLTPDKALIQLSLRDRWAEAFWFTFFHEAAHILLHSKKRTFIDDGQSSDELEGEADRFALDLLIPAEHLPRMATLRTASDVRAFANAIGVGSGIVAGRLHKENMIPKNWFNKADIHPRYTFR